MPERGSFELTTEDLGDAIRIVALRGDADRHRVPEVSQALQTARADGRATVVDLSQTEFMDSSMLAAFVAASDDSRYGGGDLVLVVGTPRLRRSLEVKGLGGILRVADTRAHAIELLGAGGGESVPESA